ncbi:MAG: hypothetical protein KDB07_04760 [Planctomycetes bacterium]|nr:hypothetical protein [Planctomycetota bacterium]
MLPDATRRIAADLLSVLDLLVRRKLPQLDEPWHLNLQQLWLWRERLIDIAELLEKADLIAQSLLVSPFDLLSLEAPESEDTSTPLTPFNETLIDYATTEYVEEEARALAEDEEERSLLSIAEQLARVDEIVSAFSASGRQAPENLLLERARLLDGLSEGESDEASSEPPEDGQNTDAPSPLTMEERLAIFRDGHRSLIATLALAIENLRDWVVNKPENFRTLP